jgi:hypothetical protein
MTGNSLLNLVDAASDASSVSPATTCNPVSLCDLRRARRRSLLFRHSRVPRPGHVPCRSVPERDDSRTLPTSERAEKWWTKPT